MATATPSESSAERSDRGGSAAILLNSTVALLLGGLITVLLHNAAQWLAGALLGVRAELFPFGVWFFPALAGGPAVIAALTGPILILLTGMAMQILQPFRFRGDFAHLLWIWIACASLMLAAVQLLVAPVGGDVGTALRALHAPGWIAWVAAAFGVLGVLSVAREWAIHSTRLCGRNRTRLLSFSVYPWLISVPLGVLLAFGEVAAAQLTTRELQADAVDRWLIVLPLAASTVFAPLSLLLVRRVSELEEPLEVKAVPVVGLVALVVLIGVSLAFARGVPLG